MIPAQAGRWEPEFPRWMASLAVCGAAVIGLAYPLTPTPLPALTVPVLVFGAALAAVSLRRIEVGIAAAIVLVMLNPAMISPPAWLPGVAWVLVLGSLCGIRAMLTSTARPAGEATVAIPVCRPGRGSGSRWRRPSSLALAVLAYAVVLVGGVLVTPVVAATTGLLRSTLTGIVLFAVIAGSVRTPAQMRWVLGGFAVAAALPCAWVLFFPQYLGPIARGFGRLDVSGMLFQRLVAGYGHPNQFAALLLLLIPVLLAAAVMVKAGRVIYLVVVALAIVALLGTLSRAALLGLPFVPLFFLVLHRPGFSAALVSIGAAGALVAAAVAVGGVQLPAGIGAADDGIVGSTQLAGRLDFWRVGLDVWAEHPVLGAGPGSFPLAYAESPAVGKAFLPDTLEEPPPHAHNLFIHQLAESGLVGFAVLLWLLGAATATAIRVVRRHSSWARPLGSAGLGTLVALVIQNQLDVTLFEANTVLFLSLLGLLTAAANLPEDGHATLS